MLYSLVLVIVVVVMMMLVGTFAMELTAALIMPMPPMMVFPPTAGNPNPFVTIVPISRTFRVIRPIAHADREIDRHCARPHQQAKGKGSHYQNCNFRFHIVINSSHPSASVAPSNRNCRAGADMTRQMKR